MRVPRAFGQVMLVSPRRRRRVGCADADIREMAAKMVEDLLKVGALDEVGKQTFYTTIDAYEDM